MFLHWKLISKEKSFNFDLVGFVDLHENPFRITFLNYTMAKVDIFNAWKAWRCLCVDQHCALLNLGTVRPIQELVPAP